MKAKMKKFLVIVSIEVEARTSGIAGSIVRNQLLPVTQKAVKKVVIQPVQEVK